MYAWDNYSRELVKGWTFQGMSALQISRDWPWLRCPSVTEIEDLQMEFIEHEHQRESTRRHGALPKLRR